MELHSQQYAWEQYATHAVSWVATSSTRRIRMKSFHYRLILVTVVVLAVTCELSVGM